MIIFGDLFDACLCVYTQTGEDNGDQTDQCNGPGPCMTLSTVGDRREKLRWLWRLTHWQDTLPVVCGAASPLDLWFATYFCVVCTTIHCERWHLHKWHPLHILTRDGKWAKNEWISSPSSLTASKDSVQSKFCKLKRHLLIFSDSVSLLRCSFTNGVPLATYPSWLQH